MDDDAVPGGFRRRSWGAEPEPEEDGETNTDAWSPNQPVVAADHLLMWLIVSEPRGFRGAVLHVQPDQVLGRQGDVAWNDERMSRRHARFTLEADPNTPDDPTPVYFVWPLEARNAVRLNGRAIRGAERIQENDRLQLGDTVFVVKTLL
jgi:hypothetical protein